MSGFVGWVDFKRDLTSQQDVLLAMTQTMQSRGPAGNGSWLSKHAGFGHRRSAASGEEGTMQVKSIDSAGYLVAAHSGKISNIEDLRNELNLTSNPCLTGSVSEVLINAYLHWGNNFIERLRGSFAFALWDERNLQLLLGRDRMGVKPLYYFEFPGGFLYASEPKGIMANPLFTARLDYTAFPILLQPRLARSGETPLLGLSEVPAAHLIRYSKNGLSSRRYWRLTSAPHNDSQEKTAQHIRSLVEEIIGAELSKSHQTGAMLSGGIDSTCVAALTIKTLHKNQPDAVLNTYCIQFDNDSHHFKSSELRPDIDAPFAEQAANFIGSKHQTITISATDIVDALPATRRARDLPAWGQFDASMYILFQEVGKNCKKVFTGEAADEIFGGYPYLFKPELINRGQFPWLADGPKLSDYLSREIRQYVDPMKDELDRYHELLSDVPKLPGEDTENARMRETLYLGMCGPLQVVLDRKDRMSAAAGLEVSVPFCDHKLLEYVWNIPWSMKTAGGLKGLLKTTMADLLPKTTLDRKKSAYPHFQDPIYENGLVREATEIANDTSSPVYDFFNIVALKQLISELGDNSMNKILFPGGASAPYMLVHLVELNRWMKDYKVSI